MADKSQNLSSFSSGQKRNELKNSFETTELKNENKYIHIAQQTASQKCICVKCHKNSG